MTIELPLLKLTSTPMVEVTDLSNFLTVNVDKVHEVIKEYKDSLVDLGTINFLELTAVNSNNITVTLKTYLSLTAINTVRTSLDVNKDYLEELTTLMEDVENYLQSSPSKTITDSELLLEASPCHSAVEYTYAFMSLEEIKDEDSRESLKKFLDMQMKNDMDIYVKAIKSLEEPQPRAPQFQDPKPPSYISCVKRAKQLGYRVSSKAESLLEVFLLSIIKEAIDSGKPGFSCTITNGEKQFEYGDLLDKHINAYFS